MSIHRFLVASLSVIVLACGVQMADAQTGPVKKVSNASPAVKEAAATPNLTANKIVELLQAKGAKTEVKTSENKQGTKFTHIVAAVQVPDDFNYQFEIVVATPAQGPGFWYVTTVLNSNANDLPMEKLQGLLKENFTMSGSCTFMINGKTGALQLNTRSYSPNVTGEFFNAEIGYYMNDIKGTYKWWSGDE